MLLNSYLSWIVNEDIDYKQIERLDIALLVYSILRRSCYHRELRSVALSALGGLTHKEKDDDSGD